MPGSSLSGFSPTRKIRGKKNKKIKTKIGLARGKRSGQTRLWAKKPQVEVTQGSKLWLTSTRKPLDLPRRHKSLRPQHNPCVPRHSLPLARRLCPDELSTPKVRRSVDVEPCRAPNALKSSLKLFRQCCAGWPKINAGNDSKPVQCRLLNAFFPNLSNLLQRPICKLWKYDSRLDRGLRINPPLPGSCLTGVFGARCKFSTLTPQANKFLDFGCSRSPQ